MSDFITTMTARVMGEIPVVEPLMHSMFLSLPAIPSDYTEDALPQPEPSTFINHEPNLNFVPLLPSKKLSPAIPRLNEDFPGYEDTIKKDNSLPSRLYNLNAEERKVKRKEAQSFSSGISNNSDASTETQITPNIVPQVTHLNEASQFVEVDVELDLNASTFESETKQVADDGETIKNDNSNAEAREGEREGTQRFVSEISNSSDVRGEIEVSPNIVPQVNHLNAPLQSVEADVEFNNVEDGGRIKEDNSSESGFYDLNAEAREGERKEAQRFVSEISNNSDIGGEIEVSPNIVPQVNRLNARSQSVEADVDLDLNVSTSELESNQNSDNTRKQLPKQFTNIKNQPREKTAGIDKLDISSVENPSPNKITSTSKQQIQKRDDVNKSIASKTVKPNLQQQTLAPQVNRIKATKFSVKPDIQIDAAQSNLQSSLQQQTIEKTNNNSKSQTPVSTQQQSILVNVVNDEHSNTDFVEKPEIQNSISTVKLDINQQKPVITSREDLVKTSPSIHTQTETRRHQTEPQPSPTIKVTIGRIEVRKSQPEPSPNQSRKSTKKTPALSLSDYLKQRDGK
ncbi:MAG: hypothetical protein KI793_23300 [Rivularia sp. (in: Bacteria)]|nr:hypothetical protein [Rivularia sp. MS3]